MANMELVQIVKQGRDAVAAWREENPNTTMDLNECYMSHARIPMVNLRGAHMRNGDFMGAMVRRADLSNCFMNNAHFYRADLREADMTSAIAPGANLRGADLRGANLSGINLDGATLSEANLSGADLTNANLDRSNLDRVNFTGANLTGASFNGANLSRTNLSEATLNAADFYEAVLNDVVTGDADFNNCIIGYTVFQNCAMDGAQGLDSVRHDAPSTIGLDTLLRSRGALPQSFILGSGIPVAVAGIQDSVADAPVTTLEVHISCANADIEFARRLEDNLRDQGVRTWVFAEGFRGNPLVDRRASSGEEEIERWVRHYDRLIVVCSAASLDSETVRNDITAAQEFEHTNDRWTMFLVDADGVMEAGRVRAARLLKEEHRVFDLAGQAEGSDEYTEALAGLIENLRGEQPASAAKPPRQAVDPRTLQL
ncbi:MAG: toll/interleukin-1 receptor domain-containing protein [Chloroflexi bacterium]|nr:toll/interleukin-1 receptor domain-containing protein [Chloroflexota bacterium]